MRINSHRKITMTHTQTTYINRIAIRAGKKGARPDEVGAQASVFEKSATELKQQKLLKWADVSLVNFGEQVRKRQMFSSIRLFHKMQKNVIFREIMLKNSNVGNMIFNSIWTPSLTAIRYFEHSIGGASNIPTPKMRCLMYDTKQHLMVSLRFWRSEESRAPLHFHYSQIHSDLEW